MIRLENVLHRIAMWLCGRIQKRRDRRELAAAFPPGTRIVTTGACCAMVRGGKIVQGTIVDYILEVGDYHVILDAPACRDERAVYCCPKGFKPSAGRQSPAPTMKDWWDAHK